MAPGEGMTAADALAVLDALAAAGVRGWLEGGWGVDALLGRQSRRHRDLDVDLDVRQEPRALGVLGRLGYRVETDRRPTRVELAAPGERWVDLHPLACDEAGNGVQTGLAGERYVYPAASFVTGLLGGRRVGCLSAAQQLAWHTGYQQRDVDRHDVALLRRLLAARPDPA